MQKVLLSLSVALLLCSCANAEDKEKSLEKMTDEELITAFMKSEKDLQKAKTKTKALEKLEKKVDELSKTLHVDKGF